MNDNSIQSSEKTEHPPWMDDPSVTYIPKEKLDFLSNLMTGTRNLTKNEMLQYIPKLARAAKEQQIRFSHEEMSDMINAIKKYSSDSEKQTIDKMLSSRPL